MASSTDPRIQQAWQCTEKGDLDAAERLFEAASSRAVQSAVESTVEVARTAVERLREMKRRGFRMAA